jgi:hypothetical protein
MRTHSLTQEEVNLPQSEYMLSSTILTALVICTTLPERIITRSPFLPPSPPPAARSSSRLGNSACSQARRISEIRSPPFCLRRRNERECVRGWKEGRNHQSVRKEEKERIDRSRESIDRSKEREKIGSFEREKRYLPNNPPSQTLRNNNSYLLQRSPVVRLSNLKKEKLLSCINCCR